MESSTIAILVIGFVLISFVYVALHTDVLEHVSETED